ncbi:MAG: type II toxin-antitoxin system RelE/ParE family toxin [Flexilinea sp.]|nr:type II toxin-antitoxin system RelE/ParE family toxin [Flexilinea sp.]
MDEFSIIITPDAEKDLNELDDYITFTLKAPDVAVSYIKEIKEKLLTLRNNPKRYHLVDDEPWHTRGVRRMNIKGHAAFYNVLDKYGEVYIQNIIYQKRDINRVLMEFYRFPTENQ